MTSARTLAFAYSGFRRCAPAPSRLLSLIRRRFGPKHAEGDTWDKHLIEARILDHFMGRPNEAEIHGRVRLA